MEHAPDFSGGQDTIPPPPPRQEQPTPEAPADEGEQLDLSDQSEVSQAESDGESSQEAVEPDQAERDRVSPEVKEMLSEAQQLKSDVREGAITVRNSLSKGWAHTRNIASTPGKIRRGAAKDWAEFRHDRAGQKHDKAKRKYEEAVNMQDTSDSRVVNWYRDRKAARRYDKYMARKSKHEHRKKILDGRTAAFDDHVAMMEGRHTAVDRATAERRERAEHYRKELMEKRIAAESRKFERQKRREQRRELMLSRTDLTHSEREKLAMQLTPEAQKEIRNKAIAAIQAKNITTRALGY